ncbi:MAG: NAD(P)-dependent oxidoreductase [Gemmataceae bacterium]|nr:NAD(P)-dependent oxidoreductase [Gemmataceae bacterium]MDW8267393.1 NAD(P)-dependent oxidoreductase [Gemmataceae bacterium]
MTTLVTGATGFVGSHVVEELLGLGEPVRALVRDPNKADRWRQRGVEVVVADVTDPQGLRAAVRDVGVIHHCAAAVGHYTKQQFYAVNLEGFRNLLEAVRHAGQPRVVFLSSINVLGTRNLDPATEETPCRRSNDPAADVKIEAEQLALEYSQRHGLDLVILRPGFIYGPGDQRNLPKLVEAIRRGTFRYIGSRNHVVPIVHVSDVVQAMVRAARVAAARGRIYNITDGSRTTIGELADHIAGLLGCPPPRKTIGYALPFAACVMFEVLTRLKLYRGVSPIQRPALRFLGTSRYVDIRRARTDLGYTPLVGYREGIAATLRWLEEQDHGRTAVASPVV